MLMLTLFLAGMFAGAVDAIAGGGGLITIPILLGIGMPPHMAFGTNKLQGTIGTWMAARRYCREGWVSVKSIYQGVIAGFIGAAIGALANQVTSSQILDKLVPVLLLIIFFYTLFSPKLGHKDSEPKLTSWVFYLIFGFTLGFYDGFFGPGTGAFWVFVFTFFLGFNLIKATAYTKILNLNSNLIALFCFALGSHVDYKIGLCMAAGQIIGAQLGAGLAIKRGVSLIRPLFLTMVFLTIATMLFNSYGSSLLVYAKVASGYASSMPVMLALICLFIMIVFKFAHRQNKLIT